MKLRAALLVDSLRISRWQLEALEVAQEAIDVVLVLNCKNTSNKKAISDIEEELISCIACLRGLVSIYFLRFLFLFPIAFKSMVVLFCIVTIWLSIIYITAFCKI